MIHGMPGVGKTELALQYALKYRHQYPGGVCWIELRDTELEIQLLNFFLENFELKPPESYSNPEAKLNWCWNQWIREVPVNRKRPALVVLDNIPNNEHYEEKVKRYLPPVGAGFRVLMTGIPPSHLHSIKLSPIKPKAALELLKSFDEKDRIKREPEVAKKICELLENLPLGLMLVGGQLHEDETQSLHSVQEQLKRLHGSAPLELSWQNLSEAEKQLGCGLSLFAPAEFDGALMQACILNFQDEKSEKALKSLLKRNLLQLVEAGKTTIQNRYRFHLLVRNFFRKKLDEEFKAEADRYKQHFCQAMANKATNIPLKPTREKVESAASIMPHLEEVVTQLKEFLRDEDLVKPFFGLGRFYEGQGLYTPAEHWYYQCLNTIDNPMRKDHPSVVNKPLDTVNTLNGLAHVIFMQKKDPDAGEYTPIDLYKKAIEIGQQIPKEQYPEIDLALAQSRDGLGYLYANPRAKKRDDNDKFNQAEEPLLLAFKTRRHKLVEVIKPGKLMEKNAKPAVELALEMVESWQHLGYYYRESGYRCRKEFPDTAKQNFVKAEYYYTNASRMCETLRDNQNLVAAIAESYGDLNITVAESYHSLATLYQAEADLYEKEGTKNQHKLEQAEHYYRKALELDEISLGHNHPDLTNTWRYLAAVCYNQEKYGEAVKFYRNALESSKKLLEEHHEYHLDRVNDLRWLATTYSKLGQYKQAKDSRHEALKLISDFIHHKEISNKAKAKIKSYFNSLLTGLKECYEKDGDSETANKIDCLKEKAKRFSENEKLNGFIEKEFVNLLSGMFEEIANLKSNRSSNTLLIFLKGTSRTLLKKISPLFEMLRNRVSRWWIGIL